MPRMAETNSEDIYYAVWTTAWGAIGAMAGQAGLRRVVLPHYRADDLQSLLAWDHPGAALDPAPFQTFVRASRDYFNAKPVDFADVPVDLPDESTFFGKVYRACRKVGYARTLSYRRLATTIGSPEAARAVATALSKNPTPLVVPCHRIICQDGRVGGFSAEGGPALKQRLLEMERS